MSTADPLAYTGTWARRGLVSVPVLPADTGSTTRVQRRPARAQRPAQPGQRATYRTEFCACGCLLVVGEPCPNCEAS